MTTQELVPAGQRTLEELAQAINDGHQQVVDGLHNTLRHAIQVGRDLNEVQSMMVEGEWLTWIAEHTTLSTHVRTVYQRLAAFEHLIPEHINNQTDAIKFLRGLNVSRRVGRRGAPRHYYHEEIHELAKRGMTGRQIAGLLGVSNATVSRALQPDSEAIKRNRERSRRRNQAEQALRREEARAAFKESSNDLAEGYALLRRSLQRLQAAHSNKRLPYLQRQSIAAAINRLHAAEDHLTKASKTPG